MSVKVVYNSNLRTLVNRLDQFERVHQQLLRDHAEKATRYSQGSFRRNRTKRESVPSRPGRPSTEGRFPDYIRWYPFGNTVRFDERGLAAKAPYWLIQEVGTRSRPVVRSVPGDPRPAERKLRVRAQRGRRLPQGLVWSQGGQYRPARRVRGGRDQVVRVRDLATPPGSWVPRITIGREIKAKHYIREGGEDAFGEYQDSLLQAARRAFRK